MNKCKGCQWYNKPYWSVVSPCNSCYKDEEITVYISPNGYGKSYHELEQRIDKAIIKVQDIIDIGFDYDGYNDVDNLKILVDELVDLARQTKNILRGEDK